MDVTAAIIERVKMKSKRVRLLANVKDGVQKLMHDLKDIRAVLADAEEKQFSNRSIKVWLDQLKEVAYDIEDILDECNAQLLKLQTNGFGKPSTLKAKVCSCFIPGFHPSRLVRGYEIASKIKEINGKLDEIAKRKNDYNLVERPTRKHRHRPESTPFVDVSEIFGRDLIKGDIIRSLLCESGEGGSELKTISVVGMAGVGKTALAQIVYHDAEVKKYFDKRIWVCVSDIFDEERVAKEIIDELQRLEINISYPASSVNLLQRICKLIEGEKFLLVLDDVWTDDGEKWENLIHAFRHGAPGSRILITTRKKTVANLMKYSHVFHVDKLFDEHCWMILAHLAFFGKNEKDCEKLEEIGRKISVKCKGLPLVAKTLGSLLRRKRTRAEWENILNSEFCELEIVEKEIFAPLLLSYYDLPSPIKRCFLHCAIYPKETPLLRHHVIYHWMALGFLESEDDKDLESTGNEYFDFLAARSLFQDFSLDSNGSKEECKMHDLIHDFALFLIRNEIVVKEIESENPKIDVSSTQARHLAVILANNVSFPTSIYGAEKLHSLLTFSEEEAVTEEALRIFFNQAKLLRVLDLSWPSLNRGHFIGSIIPEEIGRLTHLRYLDFSRFMKVRTLPESLCELPFLQFLDLRCCSSLEKLPDGIGNLINLRCLWTVGCQNLTYYPKGVGRLTKLRNLHGVIVRTDRNDPKEFSLRDLENLNHLCKLWMKLKGNSVDAREFRRAKLEKKTSLVEFKLGFVGGLEDEEVIIGLHTPSNVEVDFEN